MCIFFPRERMDTQRQVVDRLRSAFRAGITIPEKFRLAQLNKLMAMIKENEEQIVKALHKDLAKVGRNCTPPFAHASDNKTTNTVSLCDT